MPPKDKKQKNRKASAEPIVLAGPPSLDELYHSFETGKSSSGSKVEVTWQKTGMRYLLTLVCPEDQDVPPGWQLRSGNNESDVLPEEPTWNYSGDDVALIYAHLQGLCNPTKTPAASAIPSFPAFSSTAPVTTSDTNQTSPFALFAQPQIATLEPITVESDAPFLAPIAPDFNTLRKQHEMLLQPETGIMTQWCMMYLLEQEYYRFKACSFPMTLALFELGRRCDDGTVLALPVSYIRQIGQRIWRAKRRIDQFGHFGVTIYALMLPHTEKQIGVKVAERIKNLLLEDAQKRNTQLILKSGVAGLPADGTDLNAVISHAMIDMRGTL